MARTFDGIDDQINFGTGADIDLTTFTATAWVRPAANSSTEKQILAKTTSDFLGTKQYLQMDGDLAIQNAFQAYVNRATTPAVTTSVANTLTAGVWNFIASSLTLDAAPVLYHALHGSLASIPSYARTQAGAGAVGNSSAASLRIATRDNLDTYFAGEVGDVRLYNEQLTLSEIIAIQHGLSPRPWALVLHVPVWGLQSPETDLSVASRTGTVTGTTVFAGDPPRTLWTKKWITIDNATVEAGSARPSMLLTGVG